MRNHWDHYEEIRQSEGEEWGDRKRTQGDITCMLIIGVTAILILIVLVLLALIGLESLFQTTPFSS